MTMILSLQQMLCEYLFNDFHHFVFKWTDKVESFRLCRCIQVIRTSHICQTDWVDTFISSECATFSGPTKSKAFDFVGRFISQY
jgi:hypothetical protein